MTVGGGAEGVRYSGTLDAFRKVISTEGAGTLMRGAGANILRSVAIPSVSHVFECQCE